MDIRTEHRSRELKDLFPRWAIVLILITTIFSFYITVFVDLSTGIISSVLILVIVGLGVSDSWNRELREDGYASLSQLYSSYIGALFLLIALSPNLVAIYSYRLGIPISLIIGLIYVVILNTIAFRNINEYETQVNTYEGPGVVYTPDGPYLRHIEEIANEKRKERDN